MGLQYSSGNETVDRVGQIDFSFGDSGNWIMGTWYDALRYDSGKVNLNACVILSEIVYWYRPTVIRDEVSGRIKEVRTKFKADKLQKNYQDLADQFGLTKRQVTDAVVFLEHKGLVRREFRNVITETGLSLINVLFLDLNVERLIEISFPEELRNRETNMSHSEGKPTLETHKYQDRDIEVPRVDVSRLEEGGITLERDTPHDRTGYPPHLNGTPPTFQRETNTYTTTEITTEITSSSSDSHESERMFFMAEEKERKKSEAQQYEELIAENIDLESLMMAAEKESEKERIQMLYKIICKVVTSKKKTEKINSEEIPREVARSVFLKIGYDEIVYVCEKLDEPKDSPIYNLESYIKTLLYNAKTVQAEYWKQRINYDTYGGGAEKTRKKREKAKKSSFNNFEERDYSKEDFDELVKVLSKV